MSLDAYDAGLLGDGGGGDVDWWQDYIRAELARAHDHYQQQHDDEVAALRAENEALGRKVAALQVPGPPVMEYVSHHGVPGRRLVAVPARLVATEQPT